MSKKRESLVDGAIEAMESAVRKAIDEQRRAGLAIPVWQNGSVVLLESTGGQLVRETQADYGSKPRGRRKGTRRAQSN